MLVSDCREFYTITHSSKQASTQTLALFYIRYLSSLLMEFIETFNACVGHYFGADKQFMVMMMKVTEILIWLCTIVTWQSCRPLVLF